MPKVVTNPHMSGIHSASFSREISRATKQQDLVDSAKRHGDFLLGEDRKRLQREYAAKLSLFKGHKP